MERTRKGIKFDDQEEFARWVKHATGNKMAQDEIRRLQLQKPGANPSTQMLDMVKNRPVCTRCESMAYRTQNNQSHCSNPRCGHVGPIVTYDEYITNKLYK